jgi:alanyl-tRNA synthetase
MIKKSLKIEKKFIRRDVAEKKFGTNIYQGGVAPGKEVRIVNILGVDIEACGGTHLDSTKEVEKIIIISSERIQDNVSRITFVAGPAADDYMKKQRVILKETEELLHAKGVKTIVAAQRLFDRWKKSRKSLKKESAKKVEKLTSEIDMNKEIIIKILDANASELKNITRDFSNRAMILFGTKDRSIVAAGNGDVDIGAAVREIAARFGGKGGGSRMFAQGIYKKELDIEKIRQMIGNEGR